jgi:catalase
MARDNQTERNRGPASQNPAIDRDSKNNSLERDRQRPADQDLRTNQGVRIADNHNQLKAGERGPR